MTISFSRRTLFHGVTYIIDVKKTFQEVLCESNETVVSWNMATTRASSEVLSDITSDNCNLLGVRIAQRYRARLRAG
jgi:hypothetical protein